MLKKSLRIISLGSHLTGQLQIVNSALVNIWKKKMGYNESVHQLFIDFKKPVIQLGERSCIIF